MGTVVYMTYFTFQHKAEVAKTGEKTGSFFRKSDSEAYNKFYADYIDEPYLATFKRALGFGKDWMTELPLSQRLKIEE